MLVKCSKAIRLESDLSWLVNWPAGPYGPPAASRKCCPVVHTVTIDDSAEELRPLPKCKSNSEVSKDQTTTMQELLFQGL